MNTALTLELAGTSIVEACPDCGHNTMNVWGYVYRGGVPHAVYFIRWTEGHLDRGAQMLVSVGTWGAGTTAACRRSVGLECRVDENGPACMIIDATQTPWGDVEMLGAKLSRTDVIGTALSKDVFNIFDCLIEDDPRFHRFLAGGRFS